MEELFKSGSIAFDSFVKQCKQSLTFENDPLYAFIVVDLKENKLFKNGLCKESLDKVLSIFESKKLQPSSIKPHYGSHKVSFFFPAASCKNKTFCSDIRNDLSVITDKIFFSNEPVSVDFIGLGAFTDVKVRESFFNLFPKSEFISAQS